MQLTLLDFYKELNNFQLAKMKRQRPKDFFSPSLKVNNYSLVRSKIAAHEINKDLGAELGKYVNKVLEKKLD